MFFEYCMGKGGRQFENGVVTFNTNKKEPKEIDKFIVKVLF